MTMWREYLRALGLLGIIALILAYWFVAEFVFGKGGW